jgi:hypothetical protein
LNILGFFLAGGEKSKSSMHVIQLICVCLQRYLVSSGTPDLVGWKLEVWNRKLEVAGLFKRAFMVDLDW